MNSNPRLTLHTVQHRSGLATTDDSRRLGKAAVLLPPAGSAADLADLQTHLGSCDN